MKKNYRTTARRAGAGRMTPWKAKLDAQRLAQEAFLALPDTVTIAVSELAGDLGARRTAGVDEPKRRHDRGDVRGARLGNGRPRDLR